ncbi:N-terminal kinase-like protein isoform X2 [Eriocheir sinensis]|uniref:N-terminal kinase-like protein isoform X2 n=1 Tax=Eriocheir sinensis TaxID=95602 RepID=UPI0021C838F9|nr:N-terminal kinase-like protein isoform X2 [Eriocheir sinensis]
MWSIFSRDPSSSFPYELGEPLGPEDGRSIWRLQKGKKKQNGEEVSIFVCGSGKEANPAHVEAAKAAVKRLKTLRHPCVLTYIDSLESDKQVQLVTEPVSPLLTWLSESALSPAQRSSAIAWGLLQVTKGLSFLNNEGGLTHHNVCAGSVFVTAGGEWKLGGVEYCCSTDHVAFPSKPLPALDVYNPPERYDPSKQHNMSKWAADMWGLGCLVWETFSGPLDQSASLRNTAKIPKSLVPTYTRLVGASPGSRPNPREVLSTLRQPGQFFHNDLVETLTFLDEIQIKDSNERHRFFSQLAGRLDSIPQCVAVNKVLPALLSAHEFSNAGSAVLAPLFKIGQLLGEAEYQQQIVPCVVRLFSSSDRATRLRLLQQAGDLAPHIDPATLNSQVFPHLASGFLDTNPTIRENTVKSIRFFGPKLNYQNLNVEVLKHFARLQAKDEQGGIRTNTTVCLGKVASYLHPDVRQKCLVSAFLRATRDPFPPARIAGVLALAATQQFYALQDVANKILPSLCVLTLDPEKNVRDAVFKVLKGFLSKVEKVSEDPSLKEQMEAEVRQASSSSQPSSWAGWAVGAITSKFYKGGPTTSGNPSAPSTPTPTGSNKNPPSSPTPSSGSHTPSTVTSSMAPTPSPDLAGRGAAEEEEEEVEDSWDTTEWGSLEECEETEGSGGDLAVGGEAGGGGWEDAEDWIGLGGGFGSTTSNQHQLGGGGGGGLGSLDSAFSSLSTSTSVKPSNPPRQPQQLSLDDANSFFNSLTPSSGSKVGASRLGPAAAPPSAKPSSNLGGWDEWGQEGAMLAQGPSSSSGKGDEARQQREERRQQRQREIEAKRAARAGPMKLGAKRI